MANVICAIYNTDWSSDPDTTPVLFDGWDIDTGDDLIVEIIEGSDPGSGASNTGGNYDGTNYTSMSAMEADRNGAYASVLIKTFGNARSSDGLFDTDAYILQVTGTDECVDFDNDYAVDKFLSITFDGVQLYYSGVENDWQTFYLHQDAGAGAINILNCYCKLGTDIGANIKSRSTNDTVNVLKLINCVVENGHHGIHIDYSILAAHIINCNIVGISTDAIECDGFTVYPVNCAVYDNLDDFQDSFPSGYPLYCASDQGAGQGTSGVDISATWDSTCFTNYATGDWHIQDVDSPLYHAGLDPDSNANIPSTDINGVARPTGSNGVSIGAFELVTGATISMDALTLASSLKGATPSMGAVSFAMDALAVASAATGLTPSMGVVGLNMDALSLSGAAASFTWSGVNSLDMSELTLAGSAGQLGLSLGAVAMPMDALALASAVKSFTWNGVNTLPMDAIVLDSSPGAFLLVPGDVSLAMDTLVLAGAPGALTVSLITYILLNALSLSSSAKNITLGLGETQIALDQLVLASSPKAMTWYGLNTIAMDALVLVGNGGAATLSMGGVNLAMDALVLAGAVQGLTAGIVVPAKISLNLGGGILLRLDDGSIAIEL